MVAVQALERAFGRLPSFELEQERGKARTSSNVNNGRRQLASSTRQLGDRRAGCPLGVSEWKGAPSSDGTGQLGPMNEQHEAGQQE